MGLPGFPRFTWVSRGARQWSSVVCYFLIDKCKKEVGGGDIGIMAKHCFPRLLAVSVLQVYMSNCEQAVS